MKQATAIAISGGMDSLVAAHLLQQAGHRVFGIHFISGYERAQTPPLQEGCLRLPAGGDAKKHFRLPPQDPLAGLGRALGIDIMAVDCRRFFEEQVVNYFVNAYKKGETPNPCMVCNQKIKFGRLLEAALGLGAQRLATGHYAECEKTASGRMQLKKGRDPEKEQSYFLAMLDQRQLERACFPLGGLSKKKVAEIAAKHRLAPVSCRESQDICFTKGGHYLEFLSEHGGFTPAEGRIVDTEGRQIGIHKGLHRYTVGQRRGINCPASEPYYVIRIDTARNRLVVGFKEKLYRRQCSIRGTNWIAAKPAEALAVMTKIRYRHEPAASEIIPQAGGRALIRFKSPQPAITPGQSAVCYQGDSVVAGGWIDE
ncbi:MAG: tRNA 2-thiouridine(34) synthase MnmA [Desulfosalsimonadaceae bacterium]